MSPEAGFLETPISVSVPRRRLSRKQLTLLAVIVALVATTILYGRNWWTTGRFIESTDDAYVGGDVTEISPHVSGFIADIAVSDNQLVRAGQLLVRIASPDFKAAQEHAAAIVQERRAALDSLQAKTALQHSLIDQAQADLAAGREAEAFAVLDAKRYSNLAMTQAGSTRDAEKSQTAYRTAQSSVAAAMARLDAARKQLSVFGAEIAEAQASLTQAQAELQTAQLNLGYTEIRAPIDGYVGDRSAQIGAYVTAGTHLLSVVPAHGLWIDANFKEDQLGNMKSGQLATIVADMAPGHTFHGHVLSLAPATGAIFSVIPSQNATGNFTKIVQRLPVRIALDDGDAKLGLLRPGLSTTASVETRPQARTLP